MFNNSKILFSQLKKIQAEIPAMVNEMGAIAQNHFKASFTNQGFTDSSLEHWKPRKRERYKTKRGKVVDDTNRAILIKTGDLKRSLTRVSMGRYKVAIISNEPYANIHNEGLMGKAWGKHRFKMPKRQFVGNSRVMRTKIETMINRRLLKCFR